PHRELGQPAGRTEIGARSPGSLDRHAGGRERLARLLLEPPLGGNGQRQPVHASSPSSSRSIQTAQPAAVTGWLAPSRCSSRSYCPPLTSTAPSAACISNTTPV